MSRPRLSCLAQMRNRITWRGSCRPWCRKSSSGQQASRCPRTCRHGPSWGTPCQGCILPAKHISRTKVKHTWAMIIARKHPTSAMPRTRPKVPWNQCKSLPIKAEILDIPNPNPEKPWSFPHPQVLCRILSSQQDPVRRTALVCRHCVHELVPAKYWRSSGVQADSPAVLGSALSRDTKFSAVRSN